MKNGPPKTFAKESLKLKTVKLSSAYRIHQAKYPDPLGFGDSLSRFSAPVRVKGKKRFGLIYLGSSFKVSFVEAVLRDKANSRSGTLQLSEREFDERRVSEIVSKKGKPLHLVDLTGDEPLRLGVPSDAVGATRQTLGRVWSAAFYAHSSAPDGILYPSRLNEDLCLAVYDRAIDKLEVKKFGKLKDHPNLLDILETYDLEIVG